MEPMQQTGTVEMVSVEWLLNNVNNSIDGCNQGGNIAWDQLVRYKCDFSLVRVIYTILERGFRVPICLYPSPRAIGWGLGNGHHRMAASILLCLDQIPVYWSDYDYMSTEHTDSEGTINLEMEDLNVIEPWLGDQLADFGYTN
jgi:hypothetical protein